MRVAAGELLLDPRQMQLMYLGFDCVDGFNEWGGLPAGKPCETLHRAGKLTLSSFSCLAIPVRHVDRA